MNKTARRTDRIILAILLTILIFAAVSFFSPEKTENPEPPLLSADDYNGKTLGAIPGSQFEAVTIKRFPNSPLTYYTGIPELYAALSTGKIDGYVASVISLQQMLRQGLNITSLPEVLNTRYRYFGFAKTEKGEKLRAQMNEMLAELKDDGTLDRLENIWYGDDDTLKVVDDTGLTGENGTLSIGVSAMDEPYNYVKDNRLTGLYIDIVTRFARRFGYAIEYTDTEPQGLLIGLTTGKFDMLATAISYTDERAQQIHFSDPVFQFDTVLAVRPDAGNAAQATPGFWENIRASFEKTFLREDRYQLVLEGIGATLLITFSAALLGTLLGFGVCLLRCTGSKLANLLSNIYVKLLQGTPMVVVLLILYYIVFARSAFTAIWVAVIGFALHFGAYISETLRSGISSVAPGQREAALALGYTESQAFFAFILPQAVQHILPVYSGQLITLLKGTAVAGYISVQDLTKVSDIIRSRTYEAFFPLLATALIYFLLAGVLVRLLNMLMNLLDPKQRRAKK